MEKNFKDMLSQFLNNSMPTHGLPAVAYTDEEFWRKECSTVFSDNWIFAGFAHELNNAGDVLPITLAGKPLLLIKNIKGNIVAFHNVCSHRCLKLINKP